MRLVKVATFVNVVGTGKATANLDLGDTYHNLIFVRGAGASGTFDESHIKNIKLKLNAKTFVDAPSSVIRKINDNQGIVDDANILTIPFVDISAQTIGGEFLGHIGTALNVNSFTCEVDIAGATDPTLECWAQVSGGLPLGIIRSIIHHPLTFTGEGKYPIILPYGSKAGHLIRRMFFLKNTTTVTEVEIKKNGLTIFDEIPKAINDTIHRNYGHVPNADDYVVNHVVSGDMRQALTTLDAQKLDIKLTVSGAGNIDLYLDNIVLLSTL